MYTLALDYYRTSCVSWVSRFLLPGGAFTFVLSMERLKVVESLTSFCAIQINPSIWERFLKSLICL